MSISLSQASYLSSVDRLDLHLGFFNTQVILFIYVRLNPDGESALEPAVPLFIIELANFGLRLQVRTEERVDGTMETVTVDVR